MQLCYNFCEVRFVGRLIDWVLYTSIYTACCAAALCMATERLINGSVPVFFSQLHILVFGSTLLVYNTPRVIRPAFITENNDKGILRNYRFWYFTFCVLGLAMAVSSLRTLPWHMLIACSILGIFAFAYTLPLLPFKKKKRLRDYGWLKILVLTTVWTIATSVLPILYYSKSISHYPLEVALRFVFIFTLCVLFDIRDLQTDIQNNLSTLPNKMGIRNSYRLIHFMLVFFVALSILQYIRYPIPARLAGAIITAISIEAVTIYLKKNPTERAYTALADGMMIIYSLLILL